MKFGTSIYEDGTFNFLGHEPNEGCEHRTVGRHRAWCYDCAEWCYPAIPCARCDRALQYLGRRSWWRWWKDIIASAREAMRREPW